MSELFSNACEMFDMNAKAMSDLKDIVDEKYNSTLNEILDTSRKIFSYRIIIFYEYPQL